MAPQLSLESPAQCLAVGAMMVLEPPHVLPMSATQLQVTFTTTAGYCNPVPQSLPSCWLLLFFATLSAILMCNNFYLRLLVGLSVFTFLQMYLRNVDLVVVLCLVVPMHVLVAIGKAIQDILDWVACAAARFIYSHAATVQQRN